MFALSNQQKKTYLPMKNSIIIAFILMLVPFFSNAQTKKADAKTSASNGEYWQSSTDEGIVKCGHGYFINKMVIKTNYDSPDDLMDVTTDDMNTTADANTNSSKHSSKKISVNNTGANNKVVIASK